MVERYRKRMNFGKIDDVNPSINFPQIDNLLRYYKFDDDMTEEVSSSNGTGTNVTYVTGKINDGVDFDGSTSYATFPNVLKDKTSYTISFWMNADAIPGSGYGYLVGSRPVAGNLISVLLSTAGKIYCAFGTDTGAITSTDTLSVDTWYMITVVKDGTNTYIYINADIDAGATGSSSTNYTSTAIWYMGKADSAATWRYNGTIDELAIRDIALSSSEITELYNYGSGLPYPL